MSTKIKRLIGGLIGIGIIVGAPLLLWTQRWSINDTLRLRNYQPPAVVAQLATDTAMSDKTRRLFYVYHPELQEKQDFNTSCKSSEKTIVLGCYVSGTGIYLYHVTDERLSGVLQVTAAHETLHVAYERLSKDEKSRVNQLLEQAYASLDNQRIKDTIEDYRKNGADVTNELHSILGSEVRTLPPELDAYYSQYFSDRLKVVTFSEKYEQAFTDRKNKVAAADQQLENIKQQIDASEAALSALEGQVQADRRRLDSLLATKDFTAYNAGVAGFNARVNTYNAQVRAARGLIDRYNAVVAERNSIATEETELVKAIDSRPATLEGQ